MVNVVLRTGKVLCYNYATRWDIDGAWLKVLRESNGRDYLHAHFPMEVVERVEYAPPCRRRLERKPEKRTNGNRGY